MNSIIPPRLGDDWSFNPPSGWSVPAGWEPPSDWEGPNPEWPPAPPDWQWWTKPAQPQEPQPTAGIPPLGKDDPVRIGEYLLVGRLGSGGMGVVYAGVDPAGRRVAVKVVHPALADNAEFRARFAREAEVLGRVTGACVAQVVAADITAERPWLATEYVSGPTLDSYIRDRGPLSGDALYGMAAGLAEAIVAIHAAGVVHRDLKPTNVILSPDGPRVIDFGIARAMDGTALTRTGTIVGSPGWISPEEYRGDEAGPAADIHNWGLLVAYAAGGAPPFGTGRPDVLAARVMSSEVDVGQVPDGLRDLVRAAVAKSPDDRPGAPELLERVAAHWQAAEGEAATRVEDPAGDVTARLDRTWVLTDVAVPPWPEASPAPAKRRPRLHGAAAVAAAAAIALLAYSVVARPWSSNDRQATRPPTGPSVSTTAGAGSAPAPATDPTPVSGLRNPAYAAVDGNRLLAFDSASGRLLKEIALPVEKVRDFAFDEHTSTLYFTENQYTEDSGVDEPLGGNLYRLRQDGTAEIVASTGVGVSLGAIAVSGDTVIYASYEWGMPVFNSKSKLHVLRNGREIRTIDLGSEPVWGISPAPDGRIGLWTHELGAGGRSQMQVIPADEDHPSRRAPVWAAGGANCELTHPTWVVDRWLAVEGRALDADGRCRDGDHLVAIDPVTLKISSVGVSLPGQDAADRKAEYDLQVDRQGRVLVWNEWPRKGYVLIGTESRPIAPPQYECTSCLSWGGIWPGELL